MSVASATATLAPLDGLPGSEKPEDKTGVHMEGPIEVDGDGPLVVREKTHAGHPMTLDQALYEMELVGHDFYLFIDKDSALPSVVYRRHGYDYGVIHLEAGGDAAGGSTL
jgi:hypothetical protein